jgi:hypothetical protein
MLLTPKLQEVHASTATPQFLLTFDQRRVLHTENNVMMGLRELFRTQVESLKKLNDQMDHWASQGG